ncbi:1-deoxy-11-beta-hydroxypentalenate dehydrogenase [compost metagenome]|uniref:SDR family NAD(P)-dependent oxidoreductase n=1 Tax=Pseudomonas synxantha TaxID=47883 RepID=A0A5D3GBE2_9PSED|nr:SDR family NAD(P)-dependent oxidoreductase [Pseudomonas synxantha]TYK57869.1 SDR family NAD(P)-dependent oxidoreductase [Pseudomonas synxantha]
MFHPALKPGSVAVITGGAAGIGLAAAKRFASIGMRVCIADLGAQKLAAAADEIVQHASAGAEDVLALEADISRDADLATLRNTVLGRFGAVDVLMSNAGIQPATKVLDSVNWQQVIEVNLWGVIRSTQAFVPGMIEQGQPGLVIITGSKQGITTPPGNPAYNVSKAGVKVFSELLQHQLRNTPDCAISAHLLIPGFVFTELAVQDRKDKPAAAWTSEQTIDFMLSRIEAGDFYILCPDNDVPRALDERRILWAAGDIVENRPPLSRWHADYSGAFEAFVRGK